MCVDRYEIEDSVDECLDNITDEFRSVVVELVDSVLLYNDQTDNAKNIAKAIDEQFLYEEDMWEVMKNYQTPETADYDNALESLAEDLLEVVEYIKENYKDEDN